MPTQRLCLAVAVPESLPAGSLAITCVAPGSQPSYGT